MRKEKLTAIDFFCGAGGFSEGLRQQGFSVIKGFDNWRPALMSHNLNHDLEDSVFDILALENANPEEIAADNLEFVPDSAVVVGSPPCVSFSMANKAGKAAKGLGIRLIEAYLRTVAVKKHKPGSVLQAWLMENVPNSRNFVKEIYTFSNLKLGHWAKSIGKQPSDVALRVRNNGAVLCAADYGSPQRRERFVCGEWVASGEFPQPPVTHQPDSYVKLGDILSAMPSPILKQSSRKKFVDPNYPQFKMKGKDLGDQFYDTGVYRVEWRSAKYAKTNHPFMGRMGFPEHLHKPCRTIMATRSASTREALIFPSEYKRRGDGEYRLPTVREAATLMGFPWAYQFLGSEGTKWKQIGNAVCPQMSAALAAHIRILMGKRQLKPSMDSLLAHGVVDNLNTFQPRVFDKPPKKKKGAKFRRHPFKSGNITIALTNFLPNPDGKGGTTPGERWYPVAFLGAGKSYSVQLLGEENQNAAEALLQNRMGRASMSRFKKELNRRFLVNLSTGDHLQKVLQENRSLKGCPHPVDLIDEMAEFMVAQCNGESLERVSGEQILAKGEVPLQQVMVVYAISSLVERITGSHNWKQISTEAKKSWRVLPLVQKALPLK